MDLKSLVLKEVAKIPAGKVATYKELAEAIGRPRSWRAVARVLARNPHPVKIPCHRVVRFDGKVGGYIFGTSRKIELLKSEGIKVVDGKIDLRKYKFHP
ncbi:MAG: MGMT family protein [Candidatus Hadarchaeales archaeon]